MYWARWAMKTAVKGYHYGLVVGHIMYVMLLMFKDKKLIVLTRVDVLQYENSCQRVSSLWSSGLAEDSDREVSGSIPTSSGSVCYRMLDGTL